MYVVEHDVTFQFFLSLVSKAKGVGIPKVKVGLNEGRMDVQGEIARQDDQLNAPVDAEGEPVGEE